MHLIRSTALQVYLQDVASRVGPAFTYNYDLTDPWAHYVEVLAIEEGVFEHHKTLLLTGAHAGIPEVCTARTHSSHLTEHVHGIGLTLVSLQDCGGASGFEEFLEAISNPHDPEHNAMAVWCASQANQTWCVSLVPCLSTTNTNLILSFFFSRYKTDCPNGSAGYDPELIETDRINKKLASWSPA